MTESASSIIYALGRMRQRLTEAASIVRKDPTVLSSELQVTSRQHIDGGRIEAYLDVELANGHCVGCWLEARHESGSWIIESSLRANADQGEDEILGLANRYAVDDAELITELAGATAALTEALESLDLSAY